MLIAVLAAAGPARAQDEVRNLRMPILMVETGGHHARVRGLLWQDDATLFSGGEDKVVKVWDFREGDPRLSRSIRPMIWRGRAGIIYAMALSPRLGAEDQRFLAVAGFGIEARGGDITVFRVPGRVRTPSGEVAARMLPPPDDPPGGIGHRNTVSGLAFDPTGRVLASCSADGSVILWDVPTFRPLAALAVDPGQGRQPPGIRALAFSPDGRRVAAGGADGTLRVWDVDARAAVASWTAQGRPNPINAVAYSPDGRWIVAGHEFPGWLLRFDAANPAGLAPAMLPTRPEQGPVEAVAYDPDANRPRLAVSIKSDASRVPDPLRMSCDVEVRDMPAGAVARTRSVPGLVHALAFSPDGRRLALAGGTSQAIQIADPAAPDGPAREIRGAGTTAYDVRFSADGKTIGFARQPIDPARPVSAYEGFDLERRASLTAQRINLPNGPIVQYQGWTLGRGAGPSQLSAVDANGQARTFAIDPRTERNAWSWTIVPGVAPSHPRTTVAVGTESGVAVFDFETGARTHFYAGHSSPIVALAVSPDGRWLASGSEDQTVLLYPLEGCDARPRLGVGLRLKPDGTYMVESVERRLAAAAMGLLPGDGIVEIGVGKSTGELIYYRTAEEIDRFLRSVTELIPALDTIGIRVRRTIRIPTVGAISVPLVMPTTRRSNPSLALFLGTDREWVLWTPQGYYDTSIEGDARFLGWHINPPFRTQRPTDFVPIGTFAEAMNRRDVLDQVWRTGVAERPAPAPAPVQAAAVEPRTPAAVALEDQPPRIVFATVPDGVPMPPPGVLWTVNRPDPRVAVRIAASGRSAVRRRRIILDERPLPRNPEIGPVGEFAEEVGVTGLVPNRRVRLAVEAANAAGGRRIETLDVLYVPPPQPAPAPAAPKPEPPPAPRLHLMAIGCDKFAGGLPPVEYAGRDARLLADWLAGHVVSPDGARPTPQPTRPADGPAAPTASIAQACDQLHQLVLLKQVRPHDVVAVVIASHLLAAPDGIAIAAADTAVGASGPPRPALAATDLAEILGQLTDYGCRVVVFLDGVHKLDAPLRSEIKPFVRDLQRKRGAITFIASKEGPSGADRTKQQGYFALGITQTFQGAVPAGHGKDKAATYTLDQFRTALLDEVANLSARRQQAACYIPTRIPERTPFVRAQE